jgi:23S rRNA (cytidine1920-2'-O)/16S rRNA (cytidine1409-2'-O)-methyltransferase
MTQRGKSDFVASRRTRADVLVVERGLAESRAKAQALILAGQVWSGDERLAKPGQLVPAELEIRVHTAERFVSRGGLKLEGALADFELSVEGRVGADVGASTGGFTDCLLQRGASKVYAIDVGHGQLAHKLSQDPRVVVMDRTNARHLGAADFPEALEFAVVDASFIGVEKLLPALSNMLPGGADLVMLVKPQFEAGRREASRAKGVIRDPELRRKLIEKAEQRVEEAGFARIRGADSSLAGPKGNLEYFVWARRNG